MQKIFLTGSTGFVGRYVLRELVAKGFQPICLVRDPDRLEPHLRDFPVRPITITGDLFDLSALREGIKQSEAVIHLVGIIQERRLSGQTYDRVHRQGTQNIVDAAKATGVKRLIHMSALGTRDGAVAAYHRTKYAAEEIVRRSGLDWTIFRPSLIHGPDGEFMQLMGRFATKWVPPVIPYFGSGLARLQPVSVRDVATCFVKSLSIPETIGKTFEIGGDDVYNWRELYALCKQLIPGAKSWKPIVSLPVPLAKLVASTVMKTPLVPDPLKFNVAQVQMSQEDNTCEPGVMSRVFGITPRRFAEELAQYADQLR